MASYQFGVTSDLSQSFSVVMSFQASEWFNYSQDYKARILNAASHSAPGRQIQVLLDRTNQDRVILGVVTDTLNNNNCVQIEAMGQPMLGLTTSNLPSSGYLVPTCAPSFMTAPPMVQYPGAAQTPAMMHNAIMRYNSPVTPQSVQLGGIKRGPSSLHKDLLYTYHNSTGSRGGRYSSHPSLGGDHNVTIATRGSEQDGVAMNATFLGDQWSRRLPLIQKKFFVDKAQEEERLHKITYPWYKYIREKNTAKKPNLSDLSLPGYLNLEDLTREYHEFVRNEGLYIIHPVPEDDDPKALHQYNTPSLYGTILNESGKKRKPASSYNPRKARKTLRNGTPAMTQRAPSTSALPRYATYQQSSASEQPFPGQQFSANNQFAINYAPLMNGQSLLHKQQEQSVFNQHPIFSRQPVINQSSIVDHQPVVNQQSGVQEQPVINGQPTDDIATGNTDSDSGLPNNDNTALLSFWDQYLPRQQPRDVGTTGSRDEPTSVAEAPAESQPAINNQLFYSGENDGYSQTGLYSLQLDGFQDALENYRFDDLFGEDPASPK
ncbi:hypothetical protein F4818DRAFT_455228 [Hypoxylon cercidicola]|nr:hypothetical protein F4818DRAFT_455228 [Hypoxylon cercidicola]